MSAMQAEKRSEVEALKEEHKGQVDALLQRVLHEYSDRMEQVQVASIYLSIYTYIDT